MFNIFPNYKLNNNRYVLTMINFVMFTRLENISTELKSEPNILSIKIRRTETLKKII
jgi:hypothetical protein